MPHVMTLHAHPERLPLTKRAALVVFACNGDASGGTCETWDPDAGCNAVRLLGAKALARAPLAAAPAGPGGAKTKLMKARRIDYTPVFELEPGADESAEDLEADSKVGGYPVWIQGDDTPTCATCKRPMRFVAQLGEVDPALNFGGGDAYVFCCAEEHEAKVLWQQ